MFAITDIAIIPYNKAYATDFKKLNLAWIEQYFVAEPHDVEVLDDPEHFIIHPGGEILFAKHGNNIVGTCALVKTAPQEFELAKMAVAADMRGKKVGNLLGEAALEKCRAAGARRIWLESNRQLVAAITLYKKLGFTEIPITNTPYARADIKMERWL
ncbi:GNAT family N-acetyltransferase [Panacibacter sp. DH6]|uniref:GNAT family N-acetyltransferase n=1 Tax=Panacibacter microcysteis TaxID=2793269 RepID=A0A931E313_9BACT|nr:GNAT family N-acetyltransferase [Panacibacter microcysteis]MBG9376680.1 GNAT family N-acetyltransferase [Panacibacter microcysteis]